MGTVRALAVSRYAIRDAVADLYGVAFGQFGLMHEHVIAAAAIRPNKSIRIAVPPLDASGVLSVVSYFLSLFF
jgi:hypothetical protein